MVCWLLFGFWCLVFCERCLVRGVLVFGVRCLLLVVCGLWFVVRCLLLVVCCCLVVDVCRLLFVDGCSSHVGGCLVGVRWLLFVRGCCVLCDV